MAVAVAVAVVVVVVAVVVVVLGGGVFVSFCFFFRRREWMVVGDWTTELRGIVLVMQHPRVCL